MSGLLITVEGIEGCGKSTQIQKLQQYLDSKSFDVILTREPGGTPISESIRDILLDVKNSEMASITELLLYQAARAQHTAQLILPAIEKGQVVLCDRFIDSTSAYQGAGRGIDNEIVRKLNEIATCGLLPNLTIVIDLPAQEGLARALSNRQSDRIEQECLDFHKSVRKEFLKLAQREPHRIHVVDGSDSVEAVAKAIEAIVDTFVEKL